VDTAAFVVSVVAALGIGGVVGALVSHYLARRREESAERRAVSRSEQTEDREHALMLADLAATAHRELGPQLERMQAERYVTVLDPLVPEIEHILLRLHDARLSLSIVWIPQLLSSAVASLKEDKQPKAMGLADQALWELGRNAEAYVAGRAPTIFGDLQQAWYDQLSVTGVDDHSPRARLERVYDEWQKLD
jgi:hypothetical protein